MAGKVIRSVSTKFTADISDFEKKLNKWSKNIEGTAKKLNSFGSAMTKSITLPALAAIAGIGALVNKTADYADAIQNMSVRTGMSYKTLQELRFITDQTGVSFDAVGTSLVAFTKTLDDSMKKGSDVSMIYDMLGINIKGAGDKLKPVNVLYDEAIKKLSGIKDETAQAMMAEKLFGRQYAEILPLLKMSAEEMDRMKKQANDLKLVLSDASINSMAEFQDRLGAIKLRFQAAGMQMSEEFMPLVEKLADMTENTFIPAIGKGIDFLGKLIDKFNELDPKTQDAILAFTATSIALGPVITGFSGLISLLGKIPGLAATAASAVKGITLAGAGIGGLIAGVGILGYATIKPKFDKYVADQQKEKERIDAIKSGNLRPMTDYEKLIGHPVDTSKEAFNKQWAQDNAATGTAKATTEVAKAQAESDKWLTDFNKKWDAYVKSLEKGTTKTSTAADKLEQFRDSIKSMVDALKDQTRAFANFVGLFDTFERKSISGTRLLNRLKAQVKAMGDWRNALGNLEKRGVSKDFLNDLRSMGPSAVDSISALSKMSDEQLKQYTGLYNQKFAMGGAEASKMVGANMKANTVIEKQVILNVTGSKGDAEVIANTIVKKLRLAGYTI